MRQQSRNREHMTPPHLVIDNSRHRAPLSLYHVVEVSGNNYLDYVIEGCSIDSCPILPASTEAGGGILLNRQTPVLNSDFYR